MMKEKIKFKHLAPYLAYNAEYAIKRFCPVDLKIKIEKKGVIEIKGTSNNFNNILDRNDYFIILKPVCDLEFLIQEAKYAKNPTNEQQLLNDLFWGDLCEELTDLPYDCVDFIFKNHYDFFGLIDKGLAISTHDVK